MGNWHCPTCGLEYRASAVIDRKGICDECDPEGFKEQYNKDIAWMKKRTIGQEHITENTFFPGKPKHVKLTGGKQTWFARRTQTELLDWQRKMPFFSKKEKSE